MHIQINTRCIMGISHCFLERPDVYISQQPMQFDAQNLRLKALLVTNSEELPWVLPKSEPCQI